jgi:alanyl-tRNA synthetase
LRARAGSAAVFLTAEQSGKVLLLAAMTRDLVSKGVKAGDLVKAVAPIVGGRGGGKPDIAQGGGNDPEKIPDAIQEATQWLRGKLGG